VIKAAPHLEVDDGAAGDAHGEREPAAVEKDTYQPAD
jgi:hypothetical protein